MIERPASTSAHRASRKLSTVAGRSCLCPGGAATTCWPNGRIVSSKVGSVRRAGNFKCWSTGEVCRCASSSNRLASKTAVARRLCSTGSATASLRSNSYAADRADPTPTPQQGGRRGSVAASKSSNAATHQTLRCIGAPVHRREKSFMVRSQPTPSQALGVPRKDASGLRRLSLQIAIRRLAR
jgi:hypothetical protein